MHSLFFLWILASLCSSLNGQESELDQELGGEDAMEILRAAKQHAEQAELESNFLARLADDMIRDSEVCLQNKMDLIFDHASDPSKSLNFTTNWVNCGLDFNICKLLEEVRIHHRQTTEAPKCIEAFLSGDQSLSTTTYPSTVNNKDKMTKVTLSAKTYKKPESERNSSKETNQSEVVKGGAAKAEQKIKPIARPAQLLPTPAQQKKINITEQSPGMKQQGSNLQTGKANKETAQLSIAKKPKTVNEPMAPIAGKGSGKKPVQIPQAMIQPHFEFTNISDSKGSHEHITGEVVAAPKAKPLEQILAKNLNTQINEDVPQEESHNINEPQKDSLVKSQYFYQNENQIK